MAESLLLFNALPSRLMHPSRFADLVPTGKPAQVSDNLWHRHCSKLLFPSLDRKPVLTLDDPTLPLVMLPESVFNQLMLWCGCLLLAPSIQRVIAKIDALEMAHQVGKEAVAFALNQAPRLLAMPLESQILFGFNVKQSHEKALTLGRDFFREAIKRAPLGILQRGLLRLPAGVDSSTLARPLFARDNTVQPLTIARSIIRLLDPQWLSSFPTQR